MKLFESLNRELKHPNGTYAPYYFRYLGYREDLSAPPPTLRASGIHALFARSKPVILKSEWIAGNLHSLFCEEDSLVLNYAAQTVNRFPQRHFLTNSDHFAPDYRRIVRVGVPGLLEEIRAAMEVHRAKPDRVLYLQAMEKTVEGFRDMIRNYARAAECCRGPSYRRRRGRGASRRGGW